MPTLEGLRHQIETATDLHSIVTTMKTLAAVSIHQYEEAVAALGEYHRTIELGFQILLRGTPLPSDDSPASGRPLAILFGSDQGMCGRFNEEIVAFAQPALSDASEKPAPLLMVVGARAEGPLRERGGDVRHLYEVPSSVSEITNLVQELLPDIERLREHEAVSRLTVYYHRRSSAASFTPFQRQLLPIQPERLAGYRDARWPSPCLPQFASDRGRLFSQLVRQQLFVSLFQACAESLASENASRIAAMQSAEKNIEERLETFQGAFHRLRQSAITEELLEVVSGFEALRAGQ